jgi:Predicted metal-binding, possibly nucleic acid-binding protein
MRLNLSAIIEVPGGSVPFKCELETDGLDFPSVKGYPRKPYAEGRVFNEAGILRLTGTLTAEMICVCDRCGEEFESLKEMELDATIVEENPEDDPSLFVLEGNEIDLSDILSTCFILDMETKFLCREDCKGLCPTCGKNLNLGPCGCRKSLDPRFAVLEQLLDK